MRPKDRPDRCPYSIQLLRPTMKLQAAWQMVEAGHSLADGGGRMQPAGLPPPHTDLVHQPGGSCAKDRRGLTHKPGWRRKRRRGRRRRTKRR